MLPDIVYIMLMLMFFIQIAQMKVILEVVGRDSETQLQVLLSSVQFE